MTRLLCTFTTLASVVIAIAFVGSSVSGQGAAITSAALSGFGVEGETQKSKPPKKLPAKPRL